MKELINATAVSYNMKTARKQKGFLQKEVADLLGVSRQTMNGYENTPEQVKLATFISLAKIYDVPVSYFFT